MYLISSHYFKEPSKTCLTPLQLKKGAIALDSILSFISLMLALGIVLASLKVPLGPFNALAKATIYAAIPLVLIPMLICIVDLFLSHKREKKKPKVTKPQDSLLKTLPKGKYEESTPASVQIKTPKGKNGALKQSVDPIVPNLRGAVEAFKGSNSFCSEQKIDCDSALPSNERPKVTKSQDPSQQTLPKGKYEESTPASVQIKTPKGKNGALKQSTSIDPIVPNLRGAVETFKGDSSFGSEQKIDCNSALTSNQKPKVTKPQDSLSLKGDSSFCAEQKKEGDIALPSDEKPKVTKPQDSLLHTLPKGKYSERNTDFVKIRTTKGRSNALERLLSIDPANPELRRVVASIKKDDTFLAERKIVGEKIAQPRNEAIVYQAQKYREKYGIEIYFIIDDFTDKLVEKIKEINQIISEPSFVGLIYSYQVAGSDIPHVAPVIIYFPGTHKIGDIQALTADVLGEKDSSSWDLYIKRTLTEIGVPSSSVFASPYIRQADNYSCRTAALIFLRNALLSIRNQGHQNLREALETGVIEGNSVVELPGEWIYTDQIVHELKPNDRAVRSYCSPTKTKAQSAQEHRKKHTKTSRVEYAITTSVDLEGVTLPNEVEKFKKLTNNEWKVKFSCERPLHTYLNHKGHKWANEAQV